MADGDNRKREADDDNGSDAKRFRRDMNPDDDRCELRFLIPSKSAGTIIGRGGVNIKQLRETYLAKVNIPDAPGPERLLIITATEDNCFSLVGDVLRLLKEVHDEDTRLELRYLVHQSQAGCVIGRAGAKVKELREKTNCSIKVFSSCCPCSTDRIVAMSGADDSLVSCLRDVYDLLLSAPPRGPFNPYDPNYFDEDGAEDYGGWGNMRRGGRGGAAMRGGGFDRFPRNNMRGGMRGGGGRRSPGFDRGMSRRFQEDRFEMEGAGRRPHMRRDDRPQRSQDDFRGGGRFEGRDHGRDGGEVTTKRVTIPKDMAGAIIGKGGARIREIRLQSKANITIDEAPPGATDRIINITGEPYSIQEAQFLLQKSVREFSGRY